MLQTLMGVKLEREEDQFTREEPPGPSHQAPPGEEAEEEGGVGKAPKKNGHSNGRCRR